MVVHAQVDDAVIEAGLPRALPDDNQRRRLLPADIAAHALPGLQSRKQALGSVKVPTLVIHGDADPLVPVEGGIDTAKAIPDAELLIIEGMGHDLPPAVWPQVFDAIVEHAV